MKLFLGFVLGSCGVIVWLTEHAMETATFQSMVLIALGGLFVYLKGDDKL